MAETAISLNGRTYSLSCGEGEDGRLRQLSEIVRGKLDGLVAEYGQVGDDRLLLLSALLIADDMLEARARVEALETLLAAVQMRSRADE
jgi:cell division protein ZapA